MVPQACRPLVSNPGLLALQAELIGGAGVPGADVDDAPAVVDQASSLIAGDIRSFSGEIGRVDRLGRKARPAIRGHQAGAAGLQLFGGVEAVDADADIPVAAAAEHGRPALAAAVIGDVDTGVAGIEVGYVAELEVRDRAKGQERGLIQPGGEGGHDAGGSDLENVATDREVGHVQVAEGVKGQASTVRAPKRKRRAGRRWD